MLVVGEQHEILCEQRVHGHVGVVDRQMHDRRVEVARHDPGHERRGVALVHGDVDAGVHALHVRQELGEQPASRGADRAEPGFTGHVVAARGDVGGDVLQLVQHPAGALDHHHAFVGEAAPLAVDQDDAQLLFESRDVAADVGLHRVQRPSGGRERSVVGDRHEGCELPEIHLEKRYQVSGIPT